MLRLKSQAPSHGAGGAASIGLGWRKHAEAKCANAMDCLQNTRVLISHGSFRTREGAFHNDVFGIA